MELLALDRTSSEPTSEPVQREAPRIRRPQRHQVLLRPCSLDELIPAQHQVRTLWALVQQLDLSGFSVELKACGSAPGRPATDPSLLVSLWLWAATQGIGSARELARLCDSQDSYIWLCGGVKVNHHTLSDFRVKHGQALDDLFSEVLALMLQRRLVHVKRISQDGVRIRAGAGSKSFKGEEKILAALEQARQQVEQLKHQINDPAKSQSRREQAAKERAAHDRQRRVEEALAHLPELQEMKRKQHGNKSKQPARVSLTDPEARIMKMGDGGFRPAYNVQVVSDTESRAILAVDVCNEGTDQHQSEPLRQQVEQRTGQHVAEHLIDGGYVKLEAIGRAEEAGVKIYAPPRPCKGRDPSAALKKDTPATLQWRQRMQTEEAKKIYRQRAATSETVNADLRCYRGLSSFAVRGLQKARCVALWSALAYNLMHFGAALLA
jgi:transposase